MQVFYRVVQFSLSDKTRLTVVRRDVINSPSEMLIKTIQACYSLYGHFSHQVGVTETESSWERRWDRKGERVSRRQECVETTALVRRELTLLRAVSSRVYPGVCWWQIGVAWWERRRNQAAVQDPRQLNNRPKGRRFFISSFEPQLTSFPEGREWHLPVNWSRDFVRSCMFVSRWTDNFSLERKSQGEDSEHVWGQAITRLLLAVEKATVSHHASPGTVRHFLCQQV